MKGSCLCGAVTFGLAAEPGGLSVCHCTQCRKQSGHLWASGFVDDADLKIEGDVRWYVSSAKVRRGFCPVCGSFLFWKNSDDTHTSFALGAIDGPTGLTLKKHIFTADAGDYYVIDDRLPRS